MRPTSRCARAARAIEEPIRPVPISARRPNSGAVIRGSGLPVERACSLAPLLRGEGRGEGLFLRLPLAQRPPHPPPPYPPPKAGEGRVGATSPRQRGELMK